MIKRGLEFDHPRVINLDGTPMRYIVTAVRNACVYYKPVDGGKSEINDIESFKGWLR